MIHITRHAIERKRRNHIHSREPFYERFWAKVDRLGPDDCWNWTGSTDGKGRGQINPGRRQDGSKNPPIKAPRAVWMLTYGEVPDGYVCHTCDNPLCVNPAHLFLGSAQDNVDDMVTKRRHWLHGATHCKSGHEYTPENTGRHSSGGRSCKTCERERYRRYRERNGGGV
jgi:hypothetical protein